MSVVYKFVEQVMVDLFPKDFIGENGPHVAKSLDTEAASNGHSKDLFCSKFFMAPIATFVKCSTGKPSWKKEVKSWTIQKGKVPAVETYCNVINSPKSFWNWKPRSPVT